MTGRSTSAIRYAEALFLVARGAGSYDLWLRELAEVERLLADPFAAQVLLSPVVPRPQKLAIIAEALPGMAEPVRRFLELLVHREKLELIPRINESFRQFVDRERGLEIARVITAVPLESQQRETIVSRLSGRTGKQIRLEESVDPAIIGGVIAQIGDQIIDDSVRGRLEQMRRVLAGT